MSDKPRVYQGVRVKTTVKELLQRHRAREANNKKVKTISQACLELQELCASTFPCRYVDPPTPAPPAVDARTLQLGAASIPFPESSCSIQMQDGVFKDLQQQYGERLLPVGGYCSGGSSVEGGGDGCNASLSPPAALPLPWCHGLSSDADYYGHEMVACSSPESLKLCNLVDPNSYSPQDSFSSSSSSCYDSPPRMELNYGGFSSEHFHYQHCNLQDSYCPSPCWPPQQESFSAPEYAPYYPPTDYSYPGPVEENYLKRDLQMSSEMCYNVL